MESKEEPQPHDERYNLLMNIEQLFINHIRSNTYAQYRKYINICCDDADKEQIILIGTILKRLPPYSSLYLRDIYIILVYIFYGLRLTEEYDAINMKFLKSILGKEFKEQVQQEHRTKRQRIDPEQQLNPVQQLDTEQQHAFNSYLELALKLYYDITSNDIMYNNVNIASKIRRYILGITGGKNKKNKKSSKNKKSNKLTTKKRRNRKKHLKNKKN
jgi:hypothetical protein